jgi:mono/diheme cytochrome c family protein
MNRRRSALASVLLLATTPAQWVSAAESQRSEIPAISASPTDEGEAKVPVTEDYVLNCSACHGLDGAGTPGVTPTLHGLGRLLQLHGGRSYLARVPGVAQAPLSDARLARLLNWVLERYSGAPPVPLYTTAEISSLRASPLRDTRSARRELENATPE